MKSKQGPVLRNWLILLAVVTFTQACAHNFAVPPETPLRVYAVKSGGETTLHQWAPLFAAHGFEENDNRIGRPSVRSVGKERSSGDIFIDTEHPALFTMERAFSTARDRYTNLIYRIHFPGVPYSLIPFNLTAGRNVGLLVVITLNRLQQPVLVTTVHTCGCYLAIVPTNFLPLAAYPMNWQDGPLTVYGETLPPRLNFSGIQNPRLLVHLRPSVHRVMDLAVVPGSYTREARFERIEMPMIDMATLERLPSSEGPVNFYFQSGIRKGYVKGAFKPLETLFLGLISLDFFVGSDKVYGDPDIWDNHFYTSLKPWQREASDMWDFAAFLDYWGWRL